METKIAFSLENEKTICCAVSINTCIFTSDSLVFMTEQMQVKSNNTNHTRKSDDIEQGLSIK